MARALHIVDASGQSIDLYRHAADGKTIALPNPRDEQDGPTVALTRDGANTLGLALMSDEVRADLHGIAALNYERIKCKAVIDENEAGTAEFDDAMADLEAVTDALASAAVDILESLTGQR